MVVNVGAGLVSLLCHSEAQRAEESQLEILRHYIPQDDKERALTRSAPTKQRLDYLVGSIQP